MLAQANTTSLLFVLAGALLLLAGGAVAGAGAARDASLDAVSPAERRVLVDRVVTTLATSCRRTTAASLTELCRAEARFVSALAECDDACQELAAPFLDRPTR